MKKEKREDMERKELMIHPQDEELHDIGPGKYWQESFYFNWADPGHACFGVARIGYRFHENQIDGLVFTIRDGRPDFAYPAVNLRHRGDWKDLKVKNELSARGLKFLMQEPLKTWRILLTGKHFIDLEWKAFTPAFDYSETVGHGPPEIAGSHFEQSGTVRGVTRLKGVEREVSGLGQRDKSWGVRDWAHAEGWDWITVQFGEDFSFNAWVAPYKGSRYVGGFVYRDGKNRALAEVETEYRWGTRIHQPANVQLRLKDVDGMDYQVQGTCNGHFPLAKSGMWLYESYTSFTTEWKGKKREGIGVIEHAFQVGRLGYLPRMPEIAETLYQVFIR